MQLAVRMGRVHVFRPCEDEPAGGRVATEMVALAHLDPATPPGAGLRGRFVEVVNDARVPTRARHGSGLVSVPLGNVRPDDDGRYAYEPAAGGGCLDRNAPPGPAKRARFVEASRFGEVNAYHHITRLAEHVDRLLARLGRKPLPRVRAVVDAHLVAAHPDRSRQVVPDDEGWLWQPLRGSRYQLRASVGNGGLSPGHVGEIQLGPGYRWTGEGLLADAAGAPYWNKASHSLTHLYRGYGHHVTRHTADLRANALRPPGRQSNAKTATGSALCDYWAATMLGTPHIWCWYGRHDERSVRRRSLDASVTMADFAYGPSASGQRNGLILAAALWDLRRLLAPQGDSLADLLVLSASLEVPRLVSHPFRPDFQATRELRDGFSVFAACLLQADATKFEGRSRDCIVEVMRRRGIGFCPDTEARLAGPSVPALSATLSGAPEVREHVEKIRSRFPEAIIPADADLVGPDDLEQRLVEAEVRPYDVAAVGDVMTGMRMRHRIRRHGLDYAFAWVAPVFRRAAVIVGNLEGPFAERAEPDVTTRNFSYKVDPRSAPVLRRAGFNVMTIANNHLLDCGREGVRETLATLARQGIAVIGGGSDESTAHAPAVFATRGGRVGLLGYYWNRRTAANGDLPGSARDLPELVRRDIEQLKGHVDHVVVTVHWGEPYQRFPTLEEREKAHHFIECGADIVVGHHPHIIRPVEVYRARPIFYSVGNFGFGSGNSKAESLMLGIRFSDEGIEVDVFPVYVQNRDPRLDYQPKVMSGDAAVRTLQRLASISGDHGKLLVARAGFYATLALEPEADGQGVSTAV